MGVNPAYSIAAIQLAKPITACSILRFFLSLSPKELKVANVSYKETATNTDSCSQNSLMLSDDSGFSFPPFTFNTLHTFYWKQLSFLP